MICFTIVNRPENLAEGAGADGLLLVICGGQGTFNANISYCAKRDQGDHAGAFES